nr:restriction endonuclease subunit S [Lysobacter penaei]
MDQAFAALDRARTNAEANLADAKTVFARHVDIALSGREKTWRTKSLGDLAELRNGINFTKASNGKQVRVLGVKDFKNYFHAPDTGLDQVTIDGKPDAGESLRRGDIVFVRSNGNPQLVGRSLVVEGMSQDTAHSGFTIRARLHNEELLPDYLGHFVKSSAVRRKMVEGGIGTNIKSLNQRTLSQLLISYPDRNEQARIVDRLRAIRDETQRLESLCVDKLADIDALRRSLLRAAFSGQLS